MNKEEIQDRYLKGYKTIYVDIGDRKCCSLVIPVYYNETLPNDFILRPEILTQIAVLNLTSKNEELQQENQKYKEVIDKAIKLLGNYKHYSTPDEKQNSDNEDLVNNAFDILKEVSE